MRLLPHVQGCSRRRSAVLVLLVVCTGLRAYYSGEVTVHEVPASSPRASTFCFMSPPFPQYAITCLAVCLLLSVRYLLSAIAQSEQVTPLAATRCPSIVALNPHRKPPLLPRQTRQNGNKAHADVYPNSPHVTPHHCMPELPMFTMPSPPRSTTLCACTSVNPVWKYCCA